MSKNILFINGSLRKKSFNQTLVDYIKSQLEKKGYRVEQLDFINLPLFNQDIEFPAPSEVQKIRDIIKKSDALWIVSPEYNGTFPGGLKNLLDWASRPIEQGVFGPPSFIKDKLVAVSGAAGRSGAASVRENLIKLLTSMSLKPLGTSTGIVLPTEAFQTGEFVLSDENKKELDKQIDDFIKAL